MFFRHVLKAFGQQAGEGSGTGKPDPEFDGLLDRLVAEAKTLTYPFFGRVPLLKCPTYDAIKALKPERKLDFVFYIARQLVEVRKTLSEKKTVSSSDADGEYEGTCRTLLSGLLRLDLEFEEEHMIALLDLFHDNSSQEDFCLQFINWPIGLTVSQLEKHVKKNGLSDTTRAFIQRALSWPEFDKSSRYRGSDVEKAKQKLQYLLCTSDTGQSAVPPYRLKEDDVLGKYVNDCVDRLEGEIKERVYEIFNLALSAGGPRPPVKFQKAAKEIMSRTDITRYKACVHDWLTFLMSCRPIEHEYTFIFDGREHRYPDYIFLTEKNVMLVKGLVWSLGQFHDQATVEIVARLAERLFEKIPGVGPTCAAVGNACLYYLADSSGLDGISHLSRLKTKIARNSTRELIASLIQQESGKRGLSSAELEEQAVPDFGLEMGAREERFEGYALRISAIGPGKTRLEWSTPEGKPQKSAPAFVMKDKKHKDRLQKLKTLAGQIQKHSTAQRDRIDRSYVENREWSYADFLKYYLNHGLVSFIARRLIWILDVDGDSVPAIWQNGRWEDVRGNEVPRVGESTRVRLWHPLLVETTEVVRWRNRLQELEIQQPMKQAHREIYLVTEAELETRTYSNRMAAHILKQHQFNALAGVRGWKYHLQGNFDDGRDREAARIYLPAYQLTCEYWIDEIFGNQDFNQSGIWDYVATDQVRFLSQSGEAMNLIDVPKIVFSEMMRDVDLFVGVCSVGNDPAWLDRGGATGHRDYWTSYSFGDLTEVGKTRRSVLEQLVPRLKIRDQATIDGKFLRVKGKVREYKIHLGSTNILMEPNDQYLCIVPARTQEELADKVFLPFEGDRGLSLILSKAMLLAEDDKIKDPTILNQIARKL